MYDVFDPTIEATIEAFENAVASSNGDPVALRDFLPPEASDQYLTLLTELIRVDMDLAYARGQRKTVEDYRRDYPSVFAKPEALERIAFEEYRLRQHAGEQVSPAEYGDRLDVATDHWSRLAVGAADTLPVGAGQPTVHTQHGSELGASRHPAIGSTWNGFQIIRRLGKGSFAEALLASQASLANRQVVLKFSQLRSEEAQRLAELQHTNIVPVYSTHEYQGRTVLCMPYLGEHTLGDFLGHLRGRQTLVKDDRRLGQLIGDQVRPDSFVAGALQMASALADGLDHSHCRGVIHRDVKPANILIRDDGQPMLLDFNLAHRVDQAAVGVGGTVPYMAPEQLRSLQDENEEVDHRADIYAIGVVLYELLSGCVPYSAEPVGTEIDDQLPALIEARRHFPLPHKPIGTPAVWSIVQRCLAFAPVDRYQSAAELRDDLRQHLADQPLTHAPNSPWELLRKWVRRHPTLCSWTTAFIVMTLAGIVVVSTWLGREQQIAGLRAADLLQRFQQEVRALEPELCSVSSPFVDAAETIRTAQSISEQFGLHQRPSEIDTWLHLSHDQRSQWRATAGRLAFMLAAAEDSLATGDGREDGLQAAIAWNKTARRWSGEDQILAGQDRRLQLRSQGQTLDEQTLPTAVDVLDPLVAGIEHLRRADLDEAWSAFREATRRDPQKGTNWLMLAESLTHRQEYEAAVAALDVAATMLPASPIPIAQRGIVQLRAKRYEAALQDFVAVQELRPDWQIPVHLNSGLAYLGMRDFESALREVSQAIEGGSRDPRAFLIRSKLYRQLGDSAAADRDYAAGLTSEPTDEEGWLARGVAKMGVNPRAALDDFREALAVNPFSSEAWQNIAHIQSEYLDDLPASLNALNHALELHPSSRMGLAGRGVVHGRLGNVSEALQDAKRLSELRIDATTRYQVGCIYALCSSGDERLAELAIANLAQAFQADATLVGIASSDADLSAITKSAEFGKLIESASAINAMANLKNEEE